MGGLIKQAIEQPVAVMALILMCIIFGGVALQNIPIQMSPDIENLSSMCECAGPGQPQKMSIVKSLVG